MNEERLVVESFGVNVELFVAKDLWPVIEPRLPPGWRRAHGLARGRIELRSRTLGQYEVLVDSERRVTSGDVDLVTRVFDTELTTFVALHAPGLIFIHAGCVAVDGRAILVPGRSFSGKTSLTAELVRQGATYLSDDFAPIDHEGRVHPYARRLHIRPEGGFAPTPVAIEDFGGTAAVLAHDVGIVVFTQYRPGSRWQPREESRGAGAIALLDNALPARTRSEETLQVVRAAVQDARVVMSERGDAAPVAAWLIEQLSR